MLFIRMKDGLTGSARQAGAGYFATMRQLGVLYSLYAVAGGAVPRSLLAVLCLGRGSVALSAVSAVAA